MPHQMASARGIVASKPRWRDCRRAFRVGQIEVERHTSPPRPHTKNASQSTTNQRTLPGISDQCGRRGLVSGLARSSG
jgi:hypothetical protein